MSESIKRNKNFFKQVKLSLVFRVLTMLISFALVRYMVEYLGVEQYGLWSVILSFINWIIFFDLGISTGVQNKVSESLAKNNNRDAVEYISTGYFTLTIFSSLIFIIFYFLSEYIDWQNVFNVITLENIELVNMLRYIVFFILLNFILSIIIAVFNAVQKSSYIVFRQFLNNLLSLVVVLLLLKYTETSLTYLAIAYGSVLIVSSLIMSIFFYYKFLDLRPKIISVRSDKVKSILSLGMKFFLLQLTIMAILTTDKIIITQLLGPSYVTQYDILYKLFGSIMIVHSILNGPLWAMYTEAYTKNDYEWISKSLQRMSKFMFVYIVILIILSSTASLIIKVWLNNDVIFFSTSNYIYMSIMLLFLIWHTIFAYFSNGINKTNVQLSTTLIGAIINIPLSIVFVKYFGMGLNGVLLATTISLSIFGIFGPYQAIREIKNMRKNKETL